MTQGRVSESTSGSSKLGNTLRITWGLPRMQVLTQWLWGVARNPVLVASFSRQGLPLHPEKGLSDVMAADSLQLQRAP